MFKPEKATEVSETQLRVAFDGDAVLFSDESERIFKTEGLDKFFEHEKAHENKLLDHVRELQHIEIWQYGALEWILHNAVELLILIGRRWLIFHYSMELAVVLAARQITGVY